MCKIKIKYLVGIICVFIILLSCFLCLYDLVLKEKSKATTENVTTGLESNIFNTDGTINSNAAKALLEKVGYFDYSATETEYSAHNIEGRTSDNSGSTIIFKMGYADGTSGADLVWQATYLYNNYLTIWLDKNYTAMQWSGTVTYADYPSSAIQTYLDDTLFGIITQDNDTLKSIFETPSLNGLGYQSCGVGTQNDTGYYFNASYSSTFDNVAYDVYFESYLWLPSFYETINTSTSSQTSFSETSYVGLWGLNSTDRECDSTFYLNPASQPSYCWLRSGHSYSEANVMTILNDGGTQGAQANY
ncbi:MAG: hypothetical protein J6C13_04250, partial [Clostridia bacterium]|nr:hypothetical protein [Clostridia bacterium]